MFVNETLAYCSLYMFSVSLNIYRPGHCPCDVIHIFQGWNKIAKGWNKIAEGWNKIAEGWNKIAKGWNKIAKGWNKIFGMGNWGGGVVRPPRPPPPPLATGLIYMYSTLLA